MQDFGTCRMPVVVNLFQLSGTRGTDSGRSPTRLIRSRAKGVESHSHAVARLGYSVKLPLLDRHPWTFSSRCGWPAENQGDP